MKIKNILLWIGGLTALDQLLKFIIDSKYLGANFEIVPNLFEFRPKYNFNYTYINDVFDLGMTFWLAIAQVLILSIVVFIIYKALRRSSTHKKLIDTGIIFLYSALLSALISYIFLGGVLDYIYLKPLFIFDLKDLYLCVGVTLILVARIKDIRQRVLQT